jgi:hypothetical protein
VPVGAMEFGIARVVPVGAMEFGRARVVLGAMEFGGARVFEYWTLNRLDRAPRLHTNWCHRGNFTGQGRGGR